MILLDLMQISSVRVQLPLNFAKISYTLIYASNELLHVKHKNVSFSTPNIWK